MVQFRVIYTPFEKMLNAVTNDYSWLTKAYKQVFVKPLTIGHFVLDTIWLANLLDHRGLCFGFITKVTSGFALPRLTETAD